VKTRQLSVVQAAVTAGCHPETIRRAIRRKELLATREATKRGRGYVITPADLHSFMEKRRVG
jgi:excisionase family DNA binding protein